MRSKGGLMVLCRFGLIVCMLVLAGCGSKEKKGVHGSAGAYSHTELSDDLSALPAQFRYPNVVVLDCGEDSSESGVKRDFVLRSSDSFPQVVNFYRQAFDGLMNYGIGAAYSDRTARFTAESDAGNEKLMCFLVREETGTLIIFIHELDFRRRTEV
ncbi:MAG: hypothetical protein ABIK54_04565 [candidate division WOR-3 bacterium]